MSVEYDAYMEKLLADLHASYNETLEQFQAKQDAILRSKVRGMIHDIRERLPDGEVRRWGRRLGGRSGK